MGSKVFANGMEVACKSGAAKVICAFPDVCLSPPSPPAGPIPIPYPVTSMDTDTSDGSSTVKIGGQEVMLKSSSNYKKCIGDEAATKTLGMGVITHSIGGKTFFAAWSSDVKIEGENADRNLDLTSSNGQSMTNQQSWPNIAGIELPNGESCATILNKAKIFVHPYKNASKHCSSTQQSDHIVQNACFEDSRGAGGISTFPDYKLNEAPCICLEDATDPNTEHGRKTAAQNEAAKGWRDAGKNPTYKETRDANMKAMKEARPELSKKVMDCLKLIVDKHFLGDDQTEKTECRKPRAGKFKPTPPATGGRRRR